MMYAAYGMPMITVSNKSLSWGKWETPTKEVTGWSKNLLYWNILGFLLEIMNFLEKK